MQVEIKKSYSLFATSISIVAVRRLVSGLTSLSTSDVRWQRCLLVPVVIMINFALQ